MVIEVGQAGSFGAGDGACDGLAREMLDSVMAFVGLLGLDGVLLEANRPALEAAGLPPRDVLGRPFWDAPWWSWSAGEQGRLRDAVARAAGGETVRYDAEARLADGRRIVIDLQLAPLRDGAGHVTRLVPSGIDVTARRAAEDVMREIVANAPVGFAQLDTELRFVRINDGLAELNGLAAEEHVGRTPMEVLPDLPRESYLPFFEAALRGETSQFELEGTTAAGDARVWLERVYPLRDRRDRVMGVGAFVVDISERRAAEDERERSVRSLQRSLLPRVLPPVDGLEIATRYATATGSLEVGGDFYEVLSGEAFGVAAFIGDVCGRGVEAAALTSRARYTLVPLIEGNPASPARSIVELNRIMVEHHPEPAPTFLTLALVLLRPSPAGVEARLALGGHPAPVLLRRGGGASLVGRFGTLVGIGRRVDVEDVTVTLGPGDALVLYTDGYTEAREPGGDLFGDERLLAALAPAAGGTAEQIADALEAGVNRFTRDRVERDDRALLVLVAAPGGLTPPPATRR